MKLVAILRTTRPSFLVLTPLCVFLGASLLTNIDPPPDVWLLLLILSGSTLAHISVNTLNEYYDYKSGLDLETDKTAFSGGSGALPDNPEMAEIVRSIGLFSLMVTVAIGAFLAFRYSMQILPVGLVGIVLILTYTQWINRLPLLCLIAPGVGFGMLMVVGTYLVIRGEHDALAWQISLVPFFLVNNLLLLNQYPDLEADRNIGRRTFPVVFGVKVSTFVYALFMLVTYSLILIYVVVGYLPVLSLIALAPIIFASYAFYGALKYGSGIGRYSQYLGANVAATLMTIFLLGLSILLG